MIMKERGEKNIAHEGLWASVMVALTACLVLGVSILWLRHDFESGLNQMQELAKKDRSRLDAKSGALAERSVKNKNPGTILDERRVTVAGAILRVAHSCFGSVEKTLGQESTRGYCLGQSRLFVEWPNGGEMTLALQSTERDPLSNNKNIPSFLWSVDVLDEDKGWALVSFGADACISFGSCGNEWYQAFQASHRPVSYLLAVSEQTARVLRHFPSGPNIFWNPGHTKAVYFTSASEICGPKGPNPVSCSWLPLIGYDLIEDRQFHLTREFFDFSESEGREFTWGVPRWTGDREIVVGRLTKTGEIKEQIFNF